MAGVRARGCLEGWRAEVRRRGAKKKLVDLVGDWRRRWVLKRVLEGERSDRADEGFICMKCVHVFKSNTCVRTLQAGTRWQRS